MVKEPATKLFRTLIIFSRSYKVAIFELHVIPTNIHNIMPLGFFADFFKFNVEKTAKLLCCF